MRETLIHAGRMTRELSRDLPLLCLIILLPLFFLALSAFGYSRAPSPPTWVIACEGEILAAQPRLAAALVAARHADGRPAFDLRPPRSGEELSQATLVLGLSAAGDLVLEGDALSASYMAAANRIEEILDELAGGGSPRLRSSLPPYREPRSDFERFVPGMMVFAVLLLIPQTAVAITRERRRGNLGRLRLAGGRGSAYLGGVALSQSICALAVGAVIILASAAIGYPFGDRPLLAMAEAFAVLLALGLGAIGVGLAVGAFCRSDSAAINLGSTFTMLFVFLSGSFFSIPLPIIASRGSLGSRDYLALGAFDLIPATHSLRALHRVFLDGGRGAWPLVGLSLGLGLCYFALAALIFAARTRRE